MLLDKYLNELEVTWSLTSEQLHHIKELMARYAVDSMYDSVVVSENEDFLLELDKNRE